MNFSPELKGAFTAERISAVEARYMAHLYSFGPSVFQVSRLLLKYGILKQLNETKSGCTLEDIERATGLSKYAVKCLMEAALTMHVVLIDADRDKYTLSKIGWFLLKDDMVKVDMDFNHYVTYEGFFNLDEAFKESRPVGLKHFGDWETIYEGLSSLPPRVKESWFAFDHYYSDNSFDEALRLIFRTKPENLMDVGGNTGKFALRCVDFDESVRVTICDLPQQIELMRDNIKGKPNAERISGYGINILDKESKLPTDRRYDAIWMSQFLDCFSEEQIVSILRKTSEVMTEESTLYIMETLWNRQEFAPAAFCLTQISLYFSALANGNSKMYHSDDFMALIKESGLRVTEIYDHIGQGGHSIMVCKK